LKMNRTFPDHQLQDSTCHQCCLHRSQASYCSMSGSSIKSTVSIDCITSHDYLKELPQYSHY
jgi:hypothetical protein